MSNASTERAVRTIRMDDEEIARLLDHLDEQDASKPPLSEEIRKHERFRYRAPTCTIRLQQPGSGTAVRYVVPTRDISAHGLGFIHGGYVHVGTECEAQLINNHGGWQNVSGRVAHCRLIEGYVHLVGVQFDHAIDPGDYSNRARTCRVLLVDDDELSARLATHHLTQLGADIVRASDGEEALRFTKDSEFDLVLMDIEMPKMNGLDATRTMRENSYAGMIVAASVRSEESDREASLAAGCDRHLTKPVKAKDLAEVVDSLRREPLISTLDEDLNMRPLISQFIEDLKKEVNNIVQSLGKNDDPSLLAAVRKLKGAAGGYGFDVISDAAREVEQVIRDNAPRTEIRKKVRELLDWCRLAR